jgi:hypothetical protein
MREGRRAFSLHEAHGLWNFDTVLVLLVESHVVGFSPKASTIHRPSSPGGHGVMGHVRRDDGRRVQMRSLELRSDPPCRHRFRVERARLQFAGLGLSTEERDGEVVALALDGDQ